MQTSIEAEIEATHPYIVSVATTEMKSLLEQQVPFLAFTICLLVIVLVDVTKAYHRFGSSFKPARTQARWYVDGQDYMSAVADAIEAACDEILIAGWQMHPQIFMKRPEAGVNDLKWRLDKLLKKKANEGVMIYVLLYAEPIIGLTLGNKHVLDYLKHKNITILQHPLWPNVNLWSHHEKILVVDGRVAFVSGIDLAFGRWDTHNHKLNDNYPVHPYLTSSHRYGADAMEQKEIKYRRWIGKDYSNTFVQGAKTDFKKSMIDYDKINRSTDPRMPWHDVGCSFSDQPAQDVRTYFKNRYISQHLKISGVTKYLHYIRYYSEKYFGVCNRNDYPEMLWHDVGYSFSPLGVGDYSEHQYNSNIWNKCRNAAYLNSDDYEVQVQVLESGGHWSNKEASIYNAYHKTINSSAYSIYIENQFFISSTQKDDEIKNKIMIDIADRIINAYNKNESFHVTLVLPLKPEFGTSEEQDILNDLNYSTLYKKNQSLCKRLKSVIPQTDIHKYFSTYGLRTHDTLNDVPVTEIIYVHSKIMIVDDNITIIGSANINDRSMVGYRDSEVAAIIEDTEMIDGKMNGKAVKVGKFSHSLRCHLMKEHLGLLEITKYEASAIKVEDPLNINFLTEIRKIAKENAKIYESVFGHGDKRSPTNHESNFEQQEKQIKLIKGNLVEFPECYLREESCAIWKVVKKYFYKLYYYLPNVKEVFN